jgi:hypothetical protein
VVTSFKNVDSEKWTKGDIVVRGFWYWQLQPRSHSYTPCDDKVVAFVFFHLILASKFSMPPTLHVVKGKYDTYDLTHDVQKVTLEAFDAFKFLDSLVENPSFLTKTFSARCDLQLCCNYIFLILKLNNGNYQWSQLIN